MLAVLQIQPLASTTMLNLLVQTKLICILNYLCNTSILPVPH